jgi:hypothetical protein
MPKICEKPFIALILLALVFASVFLSNPSRLSSKSGLFSVPLVRPEHSAGLSLPTLQFPSEREDNFSYSNFAGPSSVDRASYSPTAVARLGLNRSSGCDFMTLRLNLWSCYDVNGSWGGDEGHLTWKNSARQDETLGTLLARALKNKKTNMEGGGGASVRILLIGDSILRSYFQQLPRVLVDALCDDLVSGEPPSATAEIRVAFCDGPAAAADRKRRRHYDDDYGDVHHLNHLPQVRWPRTPALWRRSPVQILFVRQFLIDESISSASWTLEPDERTGEEDAGSEVFQPTHVVVNKQHPFQLFHPLKTATNALPVGRAVRRLRELVPRTAEVFFFGLHPIAPTLYMREEHNCQRSLGHFNHYLEAELEALFVESSSGADGAMPVRYVSVAPMLLLLMREYGLEVFRNYTRHTDGSHMVGSVASSLAAYVLRQVIGGGQEMDALGGCIAGRAPFEQCSLSVKQRYFASLPPCGPQQRARFDVLIHNKHSEMSRNLIGRLGQSSFPTDDRFPPYTCGAFFYQVELIAGSVLDFLSTNIPSLPVLFRGQVLACYNVHAPALKSNTSAVYQDLLGRYHRYELRCREDLAALVRHSGMPAAERQHALESLQCTDGRLEEELVTAACYSTYWRRALEKDPNSCNMALRALSDSMRFVSRKLWRLVNASCGDYFPEK